MRKRTFALAVPVVLVVLGAISFFSFRHSEIQHTLIKIMALALI